MKSKTLIILEAGTINIDQAIHEKLAPYKIVEDPYKPGKWDYWSIFDDDHFANEDRPKALISSNHELLLCTTYISSLKQELYQVGACIDEQGKWHELEDFGWTMIDAVNHGEKSNSAKKLWGNYLAKIIKENEGMLGIRVTTHR